MPIMTWDEAVRAAIRSALLRDPNVFVIGEDVERYRPWSKGLYEEFGRERIVNAPISEGGFVGLATGAAMLGKRAITEISRIDWITVCMDMIVNQAAKAHFMSAGQYRAPIVIKTSIGVLGPAQHSQSLHAWFLQVPGLKIVAPSDPYDAKGLMAAAIEDDAPVLFVEHKTRRNMTADVPEVDYTLPIGKGTIRREGTDVTIVAVGTCVGIAMAAAEELASRGISAEVLDPRSLNPIDTELLFASVGKTGRLVTVDDGARTGNGANEFLALCAEQGLVRGFARVTAPDAPVSNSMALRSRYAPNCDRIVQAVESCLKVRVA